MIRVVGGGPAPVATPADVVHSKPGHKLTWAASEAFAQVNLAVIVELYPNSLLASFLLPVLL